MKPDSGDKIRVLIVDDIPETRENLRKLLYFENDIEVVAAASSGEEGIAFAKEYEPHIVLMDINMPGVDGISASEAITQEVPTAQVVMMSVQSEADYLRRSMLAGARDFLTKPFTADELVSTIRRVYEMGKSRMAAIPTPQPAAAGPAAPVAAPSQPEGKIVVVFSPKGGTGCTTLAINLAIALKKETDERVALVDMSFQFGDVAVMLNLQPNQSLADISSRFDDFDSQLLDATLIPHSSGIKTLLAPPRPEMADLVAAEHVKKVLEELRLKYDYVIVDTLSSLQDAILVMLDLADLIILPTTPDLASLKNSRLFFEVADALKYPKEAIALILNKSDRRAGIRAVDIEDTIKHPITAEIPLEDQTALNAVNRGVPFVVSDPNRPISQSVFTLAQTLIQRWTEMPVEETPIDEQDQEARRRLGRFFR